ncbi:hypothetical protein DFH27DRAFT_522870 [Peziza echinospora]|nr:hypothetical protein DFH27DRAFT_522870 [Peziza echinospora]
MQPQVPWNQIHRRADSNLQQYQQGGQQQQETNLNTGAPVQQQQQQQHPQQQQQQQQHPQQQQQQQQHYQNQNHGQNQRGGRRGGGGGGGGGSSGSHGMQPHSHIANNTSINPNNPHTIFTNPTPFTSGVNPSARTLHPPQHTQSLPTPATSTANSSTIAAASTNNIDTPHHRRPLPPPHIHSQPHSRRNSNTPPAVFRCVYKSCPRTFTNDRHWRDHKAEYCRSQGYDTSNVYQCPFLGCPTAGSGGSNTFTSKKEVLEHEKMAHMVWVCGDCGGVYPWAAEHVGCTGGGRGNGNGRTRTRHWALDSNVYAIHNQAGQQQQTHHHSAHHPLHLHDLHYSDRVSDELGHPPPTTTSTSAESSNVVAEKCRAAMAAQLIGFLRVQNGFLESAGDAALELHEEEKVYVRKYLLRMAHLLRIQFQGSEDEDPGDDDETEGVSGYNNRLAVIGSGASGGGGGRRNGHHNHHNPGRMNVHAHPTIEIDADGSGAGDLDPSGPQIHNGGGFRVGEIAILLRSNNASAEASTASLELPSLPQPQPTAGETIPLQQAEEALSPPHQPPPQAQAADQEAYSSTVTIAEDGEPLQETHISQETQLRYFEKIMECCLESVYDWFEKHKEILLVDCECSGNIAVNGSNSGPGITANAGAFSSGNHPISTGGVSGTSPADGSGGGGIPLTKSQRKKLAKHRQQLHLAAAGTATPSTAPSNPPTNGSISPPHPNPPIQRCHLHQITSATSITLPRWTHYLRRLADRDRIPKHIVGDLVSFSGEIQPVDEVRHAVRKGKVKTDRDLLALVQQARKFCWQLRDWAKCRELDQLYEVVEGRVRLEKGREREERERERERGALGISVVRGGVESLVAGGVDDGGYGEEELRRMLSYRFTF